MSVQIDFIVIDWLLRKANVVVVTCQHDVCVCRRDGWMEGWRDGWIRWLVGCSINQSAVADGYRGAVVQLVVDVDVDVAVKNSL